MRPVTRKTDYHRTRRLAMCMAMLGVPLALAAAGCGDEGAATDTSQGAIVPGSGVFANPQGLTCGLSYFNGGTPIVQNTCNHSYTHQQPSASGFDTISVGDRGMSSGSGFYDQSYHANDFGILNAGVNENTDQLMWPGGTACGFKETCNNSGQLCMGAYDAGRGQCPPGWLPRTANDASAPSGCNFAWCEYQDPNRLCLPGSPCALNPSVQGIACGINDNDKNTGQCMGMITTPTSSCPTGFRKFGFYDAGRGSGHGIGWCSRQTDPGT